MLLWGRVGIIQRLDRIIDDDRSLVLQLNLSNSNELLALFQSFQNRHLIAACFARLLDQKIALFGPLGTALTSLAASF